MKLLSVNQVWHALKAQNVHIKKVALYALVREGTIRSVRGKTTVEAVLAHEAGERRQPQEENP